MGINKMLPIERINQAVSELDAEVGIENVYLSQLCERAQIPTGSFTLITGKSYTDFIDELVGDDVSAQITRGRASRNIRKKQLINAAIEAAKTHGFNKVTREQIAEIAGVSSGTVSGSLGTMTNIRRDIMRHAIKNDIVEILAQGLAANDPHAKKISEEQRQKVAQFIAGV